MNKDEALEQPAPEYDINELIDKITPENLQEPVAWMYERDNGAAILEFYGDLDFKGMKVKPLFTHPAPSWQGLDGIEILDMFTELFGVEGTNAYAYFDPRKFARAIEQALKEKNHEQTD